MPRTQTRLRLRRLSLLLLPPGSPFLRILVCLVYYTPLRLLIDRRWLTARTANPDGQLRQLIAEREGKSQALVPTKELIERDLGRSWSSTYGAYTPASDLPPQMAYEAHVSDATLSYVRECVGAPIRAMLEVGSFVGSSAVLFGRNVQADGGFLLCVDTWCGDVNMWLRPEFRDTMAFRDGQPRIYERFLGNIVDNELQDVVLPIRMSSIVAARMFWVLGYRFDAIYLDSAHEYGETFTELALFYSLVRPGGVLFGDDLRLFPAIRHDLTVFCGRAAVPSPRLFDKENTYVIHKPL